MSSFSRKSVVVPVGVSDHPAFDRSRVESDARKTARIARRICREMAIPVRLAYERWLTQNPGAG